MKKGLWITILLAAVSAVWLLGAGILVRDQVDDVKFTETLLFGDRSAADGASLQLRTSVTDGYKRNAPEDPVWMTAITLGTDSQIVTTLTEEQNTKPEPINLREASCRITISTPIIAGLEEGEFLVKEDTSQWLVEDYELEALQQAVADKTQPGQTYTETVRFADFFDYYPLQINANLPMNMVRGDEQKIEQAWKDLFKVPVDPDYTVKVTVTKSENGEITDFQIGSSAEGRNILKEEPYWNVAPAAKDNGLYYYVTGKGTADDSMDGIYCLPVKVEDDKVSIDHEGLHKVEKPSEDLDALWGLNAEWEIFTETADTYRVDRRNDEGIYESVFVARIHPDDPVREASRVQFAWNGEQLMLWYRQLVPDEKSEALPRGSFCVSVYNTDGSCYGARFDSSYNVTGTMDGIWFRMELLQMAGEEPRVLQPPYNHQ